MRETVVLTPEQPFFRAGRYMSTSKVTNYKFENRKNIVSGLFVKSGGYITRQASFQNVYFQLCEVVPCSGLYELMSRTGQNNRFHKIFRTGSVS